ncbi:MAG: hypothetical protein QXD03_02340 [Candidatus Anstonellales archaeon]
MSVFYLIENRPLDHNGNEIVPDYKSYNLNFLGYYDVNIEQRYYISVVEGESVDSLISNYDFVSICPESLIVEKMKSEKIEALDAYHTDYILSRYPITRQISFIILSMVYGQIKPEIMSKVMLVFSWIFGMIMPYYYQIIGSIKNASTISELNSITWDYTQFDQYDPMITVEQLVSIIGS